MASKPKIETTHNFTVGQVLHVHPADIDADVALNGRVFPHDDASVAEMAETIKAEGQLQPVICRKGKDGRLKLVAGYRRHAAGMVLVEEDENFRLKAVVTDCNDEESYRRNLTENLERKQLSPIDIAHAQRRCSEQYGWDGKRIAAFFRMSPSYVSQLKRLLGLPSKIQRQVHDGSIAISAALALTELSDEQAIEIVDRQEQSQEQEGDSEPRDNSRSIRDAANRAAGKGGNKPSAATVRKFLVSIAEGDEPGTRTNRVASILLDYMSGEMQEAEAESQILEALAD